MDKKSSIKSKEKTQIEIEKYLKKIDFDGRLERREYFSNKEFRELLLKNLKQYFAGKVDQDFIIELGAVFYPEVMTSTDEHDDPLMTSVCMLNDLALGYKSPKTKKGKDKVLLLILRLLRERSNNLIRLMLNTSIDYSLTPENCKEKGCQWIKDIIFDPEAPEIVNKDIKELICTKNFKIGKAATPKNYNNFVGFYRKGIKNLPKR